MRSRTSSFAFKDKPRNVREVGEQLGANLVVEGSVLRSGNRLRIDARLVQVAGDVPLWAERFDRELNDLFAIQDEISRAIVNKLRLTLGTGQRRYDTNVDTYILYLKARALVGRRGEQTPGQRLNCSSRLSRAIPRLPRRTQAWQTRMGSCPTQPSRQALSRPRFRSCSRRPTRLWNLTSSWPKGMRRWDSSMRASTTGRTRRNRFGAPSR